MTQDEMIADLLARRQAAMDQLTDLVSAGGSDAAKDGVVYTINGLSATLSTMGYNDDIKVPDDA